MRLLLLLDMRSILGQVMEDRPANDWQTVVLASVGSLKIKTQSSSLPLEMSSLNSHHYNNLQLQCTNADPNYGVLCEKPTKAPHVLHGLYLHGIHTCPGHSEISCRLLEVSDGIRPFHNPWRWWDEVLPCASRSSHGRAAPKWIHGRLQLPAICISVRGTTAWPMF